MPGRNIYEIFHHQIAYEIRLQQAMEENMLMSVSIILEFSDISTSRLDKKLRNPERLSTDRDFNQLAQ